ncbi:hypothetical protein [Dactylosporangium salmoneum]|uniref:Uncharacterized protein n=1 Tax=Dactylosporangium salmoneum TaxID=53361 RepID=A0ABN3FWB7_9ACTN
MSRFRRPVRLRLTGRRALNRAEQLLGDGHAAEAAALMVKTYLRHEHPRTAAPHEDLVDAVGWYVQAVGADPAAVPDPLAWARWAYTAAQQLHADGPDLDVLQVGADTLTHALLRAGQSEEGIAARRESIQVAVSRGDTAGAQRRHLYLASELHLIGRCAEAADEGIAALEPISGADWAATTDDISAVVGNFMGLESCHRHDTAATLAARLGRHPASLAAIADVVFEPDIQKLLNTLAPAFRTHTAQHHADESCDQPDCPLALDGAVGARLYGAMLSSHDPDTAPPDVALIRLATRFVMFPDADQQTAADAAAWASYTHRASLALPTAGVDDITAATVVALTVTDRHRNHQAGIDTCRAALAALTGHAGISDLVAVRLRLAQRLHRAGCCTDALAEAAAALTAYDTVRTDRDITAVTYFLIVAAMFDGCHRHQEARGLGGSFDGPYFNDQHDVVDHWLDTFEESRLSMFEHTRTFHPDQVCAEQTCAKNLATAADVPHQRALRHIMKLYEEHRVADAAQAVRRHLAALDPETSPASRPLAEIAVCHLVNAVERAQGERDESVLPWGRYARRAADALDPDRGTGWADLGTLFAGAATGHGAHTEAIATAHEVWQHYHSRGDTLAALGARLDLATALHTAGHCDNARQHATEAWTATRYHLDPTDPEQRLTGLLAGMNLVHLLGDCHHHDEAFAVLKQSIESYDSGAEPGVEQRERRWQQECRRFIWRSHRHRAAFHRDDPCHGERDHDDIAPESAATLVPTHLDIAALPGVVPS